MAGKLKWSEMSSTQKKKTIAIAIIAVLVGLFLMGVLNDIKKGKLSANNKAAVQTQVLNPAQRSLTMEDLASRINSLNQRFDQQELNNRQQLQTMVDNYQSQQTMGLTEEDIRRIIADERANNDISGSLNPDGSPFSDPTNPQAPLAGGVDDGAFSDEEENRNPFKTLITTKDGKETPESKARAEGKNYLPAGTTISFVSVAGMNAPTNAVTNSAGQEAMPTLLRVRGKAILPNKNEFDLQDCVVIATGYGQMADERAILRTEKMSCIDKNGQTTEASIKGTVYGEDGKPGMRGRMVSKNGQVIAQMVKIGAIQTLGNMLVAASANYDFKSGRSINGNTGTINEGGGAMANQVAQAGASGINDTFQRIAGIYEQYAQQTFPVIEVNPGRKGEIVLTEGIAIDYKGQ